MYEKGVGVKQKNISKAKKLYEKACNYDDKDGCKNYDRLNGRFSHGAFDSDFDKYLKE